MLSIIAASILLIAQPTDPGAAKTRAASLARGVNISHWFWLPHEPGPESAAKFITPADVQQLKSLGITHVRIPTDPDYLWDSGKDTLRTENLEHYRRGLDLFTHQQIAVVVDPHPLDHSSLVSPKDDASADKFDRFWSALAGAMSTTDPKLVFLEVMNEPHDLPDAKTWPRLQERFVKTMRAAAPEHTIIATGDVWGSIEGLTHLKPLSDANVIYSFHYYEPHTFTHQGAAWGAPNWKHLKDVPYPVYPEPTALLKKSLAATTDKQAHDEIQWYADQRWNREKIAGQVKEAAEWARASNAVLWCGEFGAYRDKTPADSRRAWLTDVTSVLKQANIGWCMWDYAGGFALVDGEPGARRVHEDTAGAIGLPTPR